MRIFIAGAGYVGERAADLLAAAGHEVTRGRRHPPPGPGWAAFDAVRRDTHPASLREADAVAYAVAADGFSEDAYRAAYVDGLAAVIESLRDGPAKRLVFVSSTGVYGQDDGSEVDEASPTVPRGFSGRMLLEGEALLAAARPEATTLRLSGIYGPGRDRLITMVRGARPVSERTRRGLTNRIHREDAARALAHLLVAPRVEPAYIGSDEAPTPMGEILDWIAARLGLPPPPVGDDAGGPAQRGGDKRCSSLRLRRSGFAFTYPTYREGFGSLLDPAA